MLRAVENKKNSCI